MKVPLLDLKSEYHQLREEILAAIDGALSSMQLFLGPNVQALEQEFAELCGVKHAIGVGSGTEALHLCLRALGIGPGDEVITVAWTFIGTIEAIAHAGATPVVVDIDPATYCIDPQAIRAAVTEATAAVIPVHIYGHPAAMEEITRICQEYDLKLIEDAAQAHGALYQGRVCGSLGDCAAFSFYVSKNLGGYGEGGMITTDNDALAYQLRLLRNHGHVEKYRHQVIGYNSRLDELQAAILRVKLRRLQGGNQRRRQIAALYNELLAEAPVITPHEVEGCVSCYHLYSLRAPHRDELSQYLTEHGIGHQTHYRMPAHRQPACKQWGLECLHLPETDKIADQIIQLPIYPGMSDEQVQYVADTVCKFYAGARGCR